MSNQLSITCNKLTTYFQEQCSKHPLPQALTAQAGKMMLAASSLFNFVAAGANHVITNVSNGKYLDGKAATLFAQARTDCAKAGVVGLVGFALSLVALVALYKKMTANTSTKADTHVVKKPVQFIDGVTIPHEVKDTLNALFEGSQYKSIDEIPDYFGPLDIKSDHMENWVEKGVVNGSPFIAIKIWCDLSQFKSGNEEPQPVYQTKTHQVEVLILEQCYTNNDGVCKTLWRQREIGTPWHPIFFKSHFTEQGQGSLRSETGIQAGFKDLKNLIQGKGYKDTLHPNLVWNLKKTDPSTPCAFLNGFTIPHEIKLMLNDILARSGKGTSIDTLKSFPIDTRPKEEQMTDSVMKGVIKSRPYIAILVKNEKAKSSQMIILGQKSQNDQFSWTQLNYAQSGVPSFIRNQFACKNHGIRLTKTQEKYLKEIGNILGEKEGADDGNQIWTLSIPETYSKMEEVD